LNADEWFFASLRENLINRLTPAEAFENIEGVVSLLLRQEVEFLCYETSQLLLSLARRSNTTEIPPCLRRNWYQIMRHLLSFGKSLQGAARELGAWYRQSS
jgi:hypothetical protein